MNINTCHLHVPTGSWVSVVENFLVHDKLQLGFHEVLTIWVKKKENKEFYKMIEHPTSVLIALWDPLNFLFDSIATCYSSAINCRWTHLEAEDFVIVVMLRPGRMEWPVKCINIQAILTWKRYNSLVTKYFQILHDKLSVCINGANVVQTEHWAFLHCLSMMH